MKRQWFLNSERRALRRVSPELAILEEGIALAKEKIINQQLFGAASTKKISLCLVLGPSTFGKTTLLSQAGLSNLSGAKQPDPKKIVSTKYCSFWLLGKALYVDTAGNYTAPEIARLRSDLIWQGFIRLLKKYFGKNAIKQVTVVLDLPALVEDEELARKALFCIRERLYEMAGLVNDLQVKIVFTKCDKILGFTEFFAGFSKEERSKLFGVTFTNREAPDVLAEFSSKFEQLLTNLNHLVIGNLHQSLTTDQRILIKSFPSQLENLRGLLLEVLGKIPNSSSIFLSGIYFVSSIQSGMPINVLDKELLNNFGLELGVGYNLSLSDSQKYFINELFDQNFSDDYKAVKSKAGFDLTSQSWKLYGVATLVMGIFFGGCLNFYQNYRVCSHALSTLKNNNDLVSLDELIIELDSQSKSWYLKLGNNKLAQLSVRLSEIRYKNIVRSIVSQLESYLLELSVSESPNIAELHRALQIYKKFEQPQANQKELVLWFNGYWGERYSLKEKELRLKQLSWLVRNQVKVDIDREVFKRVRNNLSRLATAELIYSVFEDKYLAKLSKIGEQNIPAVFTKNSFDQVYYEIIPNLVSKIEESDEILGKIEKLPEFEEVKLIEEVRVIYLTNYVSYWEILLELGRPASLLFSSLTDLEPYFDKSVASDFKVLDFLKTIKENTTLETGVFSQVTKRLIDRFSKLSNINLEEVRPVLDQVSIYINNLINDATGQVSFEIADDLARGKYNTLAELFRAIQSQPDFMRSWLLSVADFLQECTFNKAGVYIADKWNKIIYPIYQKKLYAKYPLFKDSKEDLSLKDFDSFFAPYGLLDGFFAKYLRSLVNIDQTNWEWKKINGKTIVLSDDLLEIFLRAAMIQKMFYPYKTTTPKFKFSLVPIAMTPHSNNFSMYLDGQKVNFTGSEYQVCEMFWPGKTPELVTVSFTDNRGKYLVASEFGPWAWFRTLDKNSLISVDGTKRFELTLDLNGNSVKYSLSSKETVNPFIPEVVSNFRCTKMELTNPSGLGL